MNVIYKRIIRLEVPIVFFCLFSILLYRLGYAATSVLTVTNNPVTYWGWKPDPNMMGKKAVTIEELRKLVEAGFPPKMRRENSYMKCEATTTHFKNNSISVTAFTDEECWRQSDGVLIFGYNYSYTFSSVRSCLDGESPDLSKQISDQCSNKYVMEVPLFRDCPKEGDPCNPASGANYRFETDIEGVGLGLSFTRYYSSKDYTASMGLMGENWQPTIYKTVNHIPVSDIRSYRSVIMTGLYDDPESACITGWNDVRTEAYRGLASNATPVYVDGFCNLVVQGKKLASVPVINYPDRNYGETPYVNENVVTVSHSNGKQYQFHKIENEWIARHDPQITMSQLSNGNIEIESRDGREVYGSDGLILESIDSNGNSTSYTYDELERLVSVIGPKGDELVFLYNMDSQIESVSKGDETVSYTYELGHLKTVTYPDGTTKEYLYEDSLNPHSITGFIDENDELFATWSYDDKGRVIMNEQANGANHFDFTYNADGSTTVINSNNASRTYHFKLVNGVVKVWQITGDRCDTCPNGGIRSYTYNDNGFIESKVDWNGNVTIYTRDSKGRELTRTEAAGTPQARTITTTWDATLNKPLTVTEPEQRTVYTYDTEGRLLSRQQSPIQ